MTYDTFFVWSICGFGESKKLISNRSIYEFKVVEYSCPLAVYGYIYYFSESREIQMLYSTMLITINYKFYQNMEFGSTTLQTYCTSLSWNHEYVLSQYNMYIPGVIHIMSPLCATRCESRRCRFKTQFSSVV